MLKITKGLNSWSIFFFFRIYSNADQVYLLITTNLIIKFQGAIFNSFWDSFWQGKMPKFTKGHYSYIFFRIYSKVYQVIYSSLPINSPSFKALVQTVFEIFWQGKSAQNYKGHNSWFFFFFFFFFFSEFIQSLLRSSTHHYQSIYAGGIKSIPIPAANPSVVLHIGSSPPPQPLIPFPRTDERPRSNMLLKLFRSWGHKTYSYSSGKSPCSASYRKKPPLPPPHPH